jgi:hypothetical protein
VIAQYGGTFALKFGQKWEHKCWNTKRDSLRDVDNLKFNYLFDSLLVNPMKEYKYIYIYIYGVEYACVQV